MHDIVTYKQENGILTCSFAGRLDSGVSDVIEDDVFDHVQIAGCPVEFDFMDVEYVSSAFLRISIKISRIVPGMQITVRNALPMIKEVYEVTGLGKMFFFEDVQEV